MTVRLLCIGDIHLGRRPSRVPRHVFEHVREEELSPAAAWRRAVDEAIRREVDAVLLAGDVVEQPDDFYEADPDLRAGIARLLDQNITVLGVAGNHDVEVLPRLADAIPEFQLLGRDGQWDEAIVTGRGAGQARILGWSFPRASVRTSPLTTGFAFRSDGIPTVGVLHCDLDQPGSHYAPVRTAELEATSVDAWVLGHIHKPGDLSGHRPLGYLGSLTGLDPTETGPHGPWLLEVRGMGEVDATQIPLAPLRWEQVSVDVEGMADAADVHPRIAAARASAVARIEGGPLPLVVGCRLRLEGRSSVAGALEAELRAADPTSRVWVDDGVVCFVEKVADDSRPFLDLESLASGRDPVALMASKVLALDRAPGDPGRDRLVEAAGGRLAGVAAQRNYLSLGEGAVDEQAVAALLRAAALRCLEGLLGQRQADP